MTLTRAIYASPDPRGTALAVARTVLAGAELSVLLFSTDDRLFYPLPGLPQGIRCGGPRALSLWCVTGGHEGLSVSRAVAVGVLILVAIGYRPRWTCVPHWYVAFSIAESLTLPNGGEEVAQIATMLLIPVCLGDQRVWQWSRPVRPLSLRARGAATATLLVLRLQCAIIYGTAGVSKLLLAPWRKGSALDSVAFDPNFGMPSDVAHLLDSGPGYVVSHLLTWSVPATELAIAVLVLGGRRMRLGALNLGVALHVGIIALMGLFSFGLVMIATLVVACAADLTPRHTKRPDSGARRTEPTRATASESEAVEGGTSTYQPVRSGLGIAG